MSSRPVAIDEQGTADLKVDSRQVGTTDGVPNVRQIVAIGAADSPNDILDTTGGTLPVADDLATVEHEAVQTGADAVLTFTLAAVATMVMVDVDPTDLTDTDAYVARATVDGTTPSVSLGFACRAGTTTYLPVGMTGSDVKVYAPTGVDVAVHGLNR